MSVGIPLETKMGEKKKEKKKTLRGFHVRLIGLELERRRHLWKASL